MARKAAIPDELAAEMTPAVRAFVESLLDRIDELERRLGQTPQNSSLPPSSQHPHNKPAPPRSNSKRKRGGQPGHLRRQRALIPAENCAEVSDHKPDACRRCGEQLSGSDPDPIRHQVWEIPEIQPIVTEHRRHRLTCSCCGASTCAELPEGVPAHQSGPRLVAFTAALMGVFRQSKRRTALFVESILGVPCSAGLVVKLQKRATRALAGCYAQLAAALPRASAVNLDETGTKQSGEKGWIWVASTKSYTLFSVRLTRAAQVVRDLLGEDFRGAITTDRYGGYNDYQRRQVCWAHLLRDFQSLIDAGGAGKRIGARLMEVGRKLFHHWHRARDGTITRGTLRRNIRWLMQPMWAALEDGQRCPHAPTRAVCGDLFERFDQLWLFASHSGVEPTNNAAERALRHAVIWRKTSFGTQSESGSRFVETLLSVVETCRQQRRDVLTFLTEAVRAHQTGHPAPSLLPGA